MNILNKADNLNKIADFSVKQFIAFLKSRSPRLLKRTRYLDGDKIIPHRLTLYLTRSQWEKLLVECDSLGISYGGLIKLVINQHYELKPDLTDFTNKSDN